MVEEARYYVEQAKKEIDLTETAQNLDPALEQDNADCDEEVDAEHPDFIHIDPGQITTVTNTTPTYFLTEMTYFLTKMNYFLTKMTYFQK